MKSSDITRPTLAMIRARASECGIEIGAEREAAILAGAQSLHDAAKRLDRIATADAKPPAPVRP